MKKKLLTFATCLMLAVSVCFGVVGLSACKKKETKTTEPDPKDYVVGTWTLHKQERWINDELSFTNTENFNNYTPETITFNADGTWHEEGIENASGFVSATWTFENNSGWAYINGEYNGQAYTETAYKIIYEDNQLVLILCNGDTWDNTKQAADWGYYKQA